MQTTPGQEFPTGPTEAAAAPATESVAKTYKRPDHLIPDAKKAFDPNANITVGGQKLSRRPNKTIDVPADASAAEVAKASMQADVDAHVNGFLVALRNAAHEQVGPAERDKNVAELIAFGKDQLGVDPEEMFDKLSANGVDAKKFLPEVGNENGQNSHDDKTQPQAENTNNAETAEHGERVKRLMQEARVVGQRVVSADLGARHTGNDGVRAYLYLRDVQPETLDPQKAILEGANLPQITVDIGGKGNTKTVGVRQILGITIGPDGRRVAHIRYERATVGGNTGHGEVDVPMDAILDAQVLAEADNFSSLLAADPNEQASFDLYVAALKGGKTAEDAFKDTEAADKALLGAAQQVGLMTREDILAYVGNMKDQLPKNPDGTLAPQSLPESRALDSLAARVANVTLVEPDMVQSIVIDELQIGNPGSKDDLAQKLGGVNSTISSIEAQMRDLERSDLSADKKMEERAKLTGALHSARDTQRQLEMLQVVAGVGEAMQNGTAGSTVAEYFGKLKSGEISIQDAQKTMADFRNGDYLKFLDRINPIDRNPKGTETPEETSARIAEEEKKRRQLIGAGKGAGLLILLMAALAATVVNPQQMR